MNDTRPLTPDEAWEVLGLDKTPFEDSPRDSTSNGQKTKSVLAQRRAVGRRDPARRPRLTAP